MIKYDKDKTRYFDKHGNEIHAGDLIRFSDGRVKKVFLTDKDELGTDATNPQWIAMGKAVPGEYGIYPLEPNDTDNCEVYVCTPANETDWKTDDVQRTATADIPAPPKPKKNRIRLVIELGIREDVCKATNLSYEDLLASIVCEEDDVCDGVDIFPRLPNVDCASEYFLCGGTIVERELIE